MDELVKRETASLSPYDNEYPMNFLMSRLRSGIESAQISIANVVNAVLESAPSMIHPASDNRSSIRYIVNMDEKTIRDIENGLVKLDCRDDGKIFAQIRESNGHFGHKFDIQKEVSDIKNEIDPTNLYNAAAMLAIQKQIEQVHVQLENIDAHINEVVQGLQNDRMGLYYSGAALFIESQNISDTALKQRLASQALATLAEAYFRLSLSVRSDITYLLNREYRKKGINSVEAIDEHMTNINKSFAAIHQAALLRAGIYCNFNEISAMTCVLKEYSAFINEVIAPNSGLLAEFDCNDKGYENGVWKSRSKLSLDVSEIEKALSLTSYPMIIQLDEVNRNENI